MAVLQPGPSEPAANDSESSSAGEAESSADEASGSSADEAESMWTAVSERVNGGTVRVGGCERGGTWVGSWDVGCEDVGLRLRDCATRCLL